MKQKLLLLLPFLVLPHGLKSQTSFAGIDWFTGLNPADTPLSVNGASLTSDLPSTTTILGYFTPAGNPISIGVGEAIRLEYTISYSGTVASNGGIRVGLFDTDMTPGSRINTDGFGQAHSSFTGSPNPRGAAIFTDSMAEGGSTNIRRRNTSSSSNILNSTNQYWAADLVEGANSLAEDIVANREYHTVFEIWNNGSDHNQFVARQWYMDGSDQVYIYNMTYDSNTASTYATSFDTVAFRILANSGDSVTLSNVNVGVIPEPSTWALLLGTGALALTALRRRLRN